MGFINCLWVTLLYGICTYIGKTTPNEFPVLQWGSDQIRQHVEKFSFNHNLSITKPDDTMHKYVSQRGAVNGMYLVSLKVRDIRHQLCCAIYSESN